MPDPIIDPNKVVDYLASGGQTYTPLGGTILPTSQVPSYMTTPQPIVPTTTTTTATSPVAGFYRVGNDVYDASGNYISWEKANQLNIVPYLESIPQRTTSTTPTPTPTPTPTAQTTQAPTVSYTPPQFTNNNNTVYKEWNEKTGTWDVFDAAGKAIDLVTFKNMGLNIDHINTKDVVQQEANQPMTGDAPATTTPTDTKTFSQRYADAIEQLGVPTFKAQAEEYMKKLGEIQNELNDQIAEVNDNPWLAEGIRSAKIKKLNERYEGKIRILTAQTALFNNLYEKGIAEARYITTGEQQDAKYLMDLAQKEIELRNEISQQEFENQLDIAKLDLNEKEYALSLYRAQKGEGESPTDLVEVYANAINNGELSLVDVPDKFQAAVATRAQQLAAEQRRELEAQQEQEAGAASLPGGSGMLGGLADMTYSFWNRLFGF